MEKIFQVYSGKDRYPSCRQDEKANRQTTLCHTSSRQNTSVRPLSHQLANQQEDATPTTKR